VSRRWPPWPATMAGPSTPRCQGHRDRADRGR
jgi:hypothetical protein